MVKNEDFIRFKEKTVDRLEALTEEIGKVNKKCDEFYQNNCRLRGELNDVTDRFNTFAETTSQINKNYLKFYADMQDVAKMSQKVEQQQKEMNKLLETLQQRVDKINGTNEPVSVPVPDGSDQIADQ